MPETAQQHELSFLRACRKVDLSWDGLEFRCVSLCRRLLKSMRDPFSEHVERLMLAETVFHFYALANARDCSKVWVIFPSQHAEGLISAGTVFNFYVLAYAGDCSKVWSILSQHMQKGWYTSWDGPQLLCISLCRRLLRSMSYLFSEHAERLILAVVVFNFYALAYAGDCSKVWVMLSQSM